MSILSVLLALDDASVVAALRAGDERTFAGLLELYEPSMLRVARSIVGDRHVAEEVVQDTWLGVVVGIGRFEGRSKLRTWIFRILTNTALSRAAREARSLPFSAVIDPADEPPAAAERTLPEQLLSTRETLGRIAEAIKGLPAKQRAVVTMRDLEGRAADEVCDALGLSDGNQRVLLHRGRSKLRASLEPYLADARG